MFRLYTLGFFLFNVGLFGVLFNRRHFLLVLISLELMFLAINICLITCSLYYDDVIIHIWVLSLLAVSAGEAAIGLAIVIAYYRVQGSVNIEFIPLLKS